MKNRQQSIGCDEFVQLRLFFRSELVILNFFRKLSILGALFVGEIEREHIPRVFAGKISDSWINNAFEDRHSRGHIVIITAVRKTSREFIATVDEWPFIAVQKTSPRPRRYTIPWRNLGDMTVPQDKQVEMQELLSRVRDGDGPALGNLLQSYEKYLGLLAGVQIGRRLQGKADASDIVQETFLEVHRQIANFRGNTEAEFLAWLRRILAGQIALLCRRFLGTKGRDVHLERELAVQLDESSQALDGNLAANASTPSQHVSRREQSVILAEALWRLPEDYRQVIMLRHIEAMSFPDVAKRMGRSEDSVQKLWVRALANLRKILGEVA